MRHVLGAHDPSGPTFWFVMSMALLVGFVTAYPMNWWLVSRHLKHRMMTVRPSIEHEVRDDMHAMHGTASDSAAPAASAGTEQVSRRTLAGMTLLSFLLFAVGLGITAYFGGFA